MQKKKTKLTIKQESNQATTLMTFRLIYHQRHSWNINLSVCVHLVSTWILIFGRIFNPLSGTITLRASRHKDPHRNRARLFQYKSLCHHVLISDSGQWLTQILFMRLKFLRDIDSLLTSLRHFTAEIRLITKTKAFVIWFEHSDHWQVIGTYGIICKRCLINICQTLERVQSRKNKKIIRTPCTSLCVSFT